MKWELMKKLKKSAPVRKCQYSFGININSWWWFCFCLFFVFFNPTLNCLVLPEVASRQAPVFAVCVTPASQHCYSVSVKIIIIPDVEFTSGLVMGFTGAGLCLSQAFKFSHQNVLKHTILSSSCLFVSLTSRRGSHFLFLELVSIG